MNFDLENKIPAVKIFSFLLICAVLAALGFGYWRWFKPAEPDFFPDKVAWNGDENPAYIAGFQKLGIYDNQNRKLSLVEAPFGDSAEIVAGISDNRVYVADLNQGKVFVYRGGEKESEIETGSIPRFLFLNESAGQLFVYSRGDGELVSISVNDGYKVSKSLKLDADVVGGALDNKNNTLYLSDSRGEIIAIDGTALKISGTTKAGSVPYISFPANFDADARKLYLVSKGSDELWSFDTAAGQILKNVKIEKGAEEMTLNQEKSKLYLANSDQHAVFVFNAADLTFKKIAVSPLFYPQKALADEKNNRLYVYNQGKIPEITIMDLNGSVVKSIPLGYPLSDFKIAYKTSTIYALSKAGGFMLAINGDKEKFLQQKPEISESKLNRPFFLRVGPSSHRLFSLNDFSNNFLIYSPESLELTGNLELGGGPYFLVGNKTGGYIVNKGIQEIWQIDTSVDKNAKVNKKIKLDKNVRDGAGLDIVKKIYLSFDGGLLVLDSEKDEIVKTIPLAEPKIFGVDQDKNVLYVQLGDSSIAVLDGKTDAVKNTLKINIGQAKLDSVNSRVYVLSASNKKLDIVDSADLKVLKSIDLDFACDEMAVAPWVKSVYLLSSSRKRILAFEKDSLKKKSTAEIEESFSAAPLANGFYADEKTKKIYIVHRYGRITIAGPDSGKVEGIIELPYGANPVSLKTDLENNRLYVANKWLNQIQVYNLTDFSLEAEIDQNGETRWLK